MIVKRKLSFGLFAILCYLCTVITGWSYGNSYPVYVAVSVAMAIFAYSRFFLGKSRIDRSVKGLITIILLLTLFLGLVDGDLKSSIMVNISLIMPFALSSLNIDYANFAKKTIIASLVNLLLIYGLTLDFNAWNSNTLAFMIFCGLSVGMMWFKTGRGASNLIFSTLYLVLGSTFLFMTGCRNAGMVIIACYILLLLPDKVYKGCLFFRALYVTTLLMTVFAGDFMHYILSDEKIMDKIMSFTTSFSDKEWGMDTHYFVIEFIKAKMSGMDIFTLLFGSGIKTYHCHNIFYQCVLFYGYIGTALIYIFYIYVFERAYILFKDYNDVISLSCFIVLLGHWMLQIGEVYMLGGEAVVLMALLPAGVILQRWNRCVA